MSRSISSSSPPGFSTRVRSWAWSKVPPNPVGEALSIAVAFGAGAVLHVVLKRAWRRLYGRDAPVNPLQPGVKWSEALLWGSATGAAAGIAKVLARRGTDVAKQRLHL